MVHKRRGVYDTGEEYVITIDLCPKCKNELKHTHETKDGVSTFIETCTACDYIKREVDDYSTWHTEWEEEKAADAKLLETYRAEFCLNEKEGLEMVELVEALQFSKEVSEHELQKFDDTARDAAAEIKKLTAPELETLLTKPLKKAKYTKLMLEQPEIGQHVIIPFTAQDTDSARSGERSSKPLAELIKDLLEDTNWRLMDGVSYRLGYVSGRLKGYEQEEDLIKLARKDNPPPKLKPLDPEKQRKYGHHPYVQLARMGAEHEATENRRKKKLKDHPDGFYLSRDEGPYTCFICGKSTPGSETWWTLNGLHCADCRRNIVEGVIPNNLPSRYNQDVYINDWQFSGDYGLHSATVGKLRRQGILNPRELKDEDGKVYHRIYLTEENREFLKKYPKKEQGNSSMPEKVINSKDQEIKL